jgi:hypothetical protein
MCILIGMLFVIRISVACQTNEVRIHNDDFNDPTWGGPYEETLGCRGVNWL